MYLVFISVLGKEGKRGRRKMGRRVGRKKGSRRSDMWGGNLGKGQITVGEEAQIGCGMARGVWGLREGK